MKLSIVIPALNEEGIVGRTIESIPRKELGEMDYEVEIIVVDNASTDKTAEEAKLAGARVVYEGKRGYGNAYLMGFQETSGDIIVMGDADGTYPLDKVAEFINPIVREDVDFVICSRFNGKINPGSMPALHRYIGNPILTFILNLFFHSSFSDTHCGMRAFKRSALEKMDLKSPGMEFAIEMVIEANEKNLKIKEIPIEYNKRKGKAKLSSFKDGSRHLSYLLSRKLKFH